MPPLPTGSVDLIMTDPPYFAYRGMNCLLKRDVFLDTSKQLRKRYPESLSYLLDIDQRNVPLTALSPAHVSTVQTANVSELISRTLRDGALTSSLSV
jgi:hypothetical protein